MFSFFKKKSARSAEPTPAQIVPTHHWSDEEIPRYPPFMKGLPVIDPDRLLHTQSELIQRIKNTAIATPEVFDSHYLPAIRRFATFAHLLPASQSHHHRGAGGLLRHALEVGLWALQAADKVMLKNAQSPQHRREMEPRWQLAVFLAAMCHDAGKPVTDLHITNMDRSKVWNPLSEDLHVWAIRNDLTAYYLDWRDGRGRQHTALSSLVGERIIGMHSMAWIGEGSTELVAWVMESLSNSPSPQNLIHDLVVRADQASVERDLKTLGVAMAGYDIGVPVERHLTEIMRRLVRETVWTVNMPGARVWNFSGTIYLVWPGAGEELVREIRKDGIPGLPRTPDGLLDMLIDRQLASLRQGKDGADYWQIAPAVLAEKIPDIRLNTIKLRDDTMLSPVPLAQAEGHVIDPDAPTNEQSKSESASQETAVQEPVAPNKSEQSSPEAEGKANTTEKVETAKDEAKSSSAPPVIRKKEKGPDKAKPTNQEAPREKQSQENAVPPVQEHAAPVAIPAAPAKVDDKPVEFNGRIGEALKGLAEDLKEGVEKIWGRDVIRLKDGGVQLRWPEALQGCGLQQKVILDELTARDWIVTDAFANHAKTVKARFDGSADLVPALHLIPSVGRAFIALGENNETSAPMIPVSAATPEKKSKRKAKQNEQAHDHQRSVQTVPTQSEAEAVPAIGIEPSPSEPVVEATSNNVGKEESTPSDDEKASYPIEDVIAALKTLPPKTEKGGWCILNRTDAMAALAAHNIHVRGIPGLLSICKGHEDRLQVLGRELKYKP